LALGGGWFGTDEAGQPEWVHGETEIRTLADYFRGNPPRLQQ
jgi:hypothetical protein